MQINKDRLPGARRLKVLEAKERTQQAQQEAKQAFANYQAAVAQAGPVIPGQQGVGLPPDESILNGVYPSGEIAVDFLPALILQAFFNAQAAQLLADQIDAEIMDAYINCSANKPNAPR